MFLLLLDATPFHSQAAEEANTGHSERDLETYAQRAIVCHQNCGVILRWNHLEDTGSAGILNLLRRYI